MNRLIVVLILAAGAILGGVVAYSYMQAFAIPDAQQEGRDRLIAEQAVQFQREEFERKGDDAKLQRMSDYDLCAAYLAGCQSATVSGCSPFTANSLSPAGTVALL